MSETMSTMIEDWYHQELQEETVSEGDEEAVHEDQRVTNGNISDRAAIPPDWDPLSFDFYCKSFNSYLHGPGKSLSEMADGRKQQEHVRLHFNDIPEQFDKGGLVALCAKVKPSVIAGEMFLNRKTGQVWAILEFPCLRDAQEVLLKFNKKPPLNMRVTFGKSIEARVNGESIRLHKAIWKYRKERDEAMNIISDAGVPHQNREFEEASKLNPKNRMREDSRLSLLDFADDYYFSWKYQSKIGEILPPRQPFLSRAIAPLKINLEHVRATVDLNLTNAHQDQELDYFGHYSFGFFDETSSVLEAVYNEYKFKDSKACKIYGGRAYELFGSYAVVNKSVHMGTSIDMAPVTIGEESTFKMLSKNLSIGPEGRISKCTVCQKITSTCCSTCFLPFCSANCTKVHGDDHSKQTCSYLSTTSEVDPLFSQKLTRIPNAVKDNNCPFPLMMHPGTPLIKQNAPKSIISMLTSHVADLVVQDIVTQFGEPQGFTCLVYNSELKPYFKIISKLHRNNVAADVSCTNLIEIGPNFGVGELNCAPLSGKMCRVMLRQKLPHGWSCIFVDRGEVCDICEDQISNIQAEFVPLPRISLFATVTKYETSFQNLWTKNIQPKKRLHLKDLKVLEGGAQLSANMENDKGVKLCSLLISDWLPLRPSAPFKIAPAIRLKNKDSVTISTLCSSNLCYVQLVGRYQEQCSLEIEINFAGMSEPPFSELPEAGSIVAVRSAIDSKFYRAMVKLPTSEFTAIVFYVDFGNREEVEVTQMFPLPNAVAMKPAEAVLLRLADVPEKPFTMEAFMILAQFVELKELMEVELDDDGKYATLISAKSTISVNRRLCDALLGKVSKELAVSELLETYDTSEDLLPTQFPLTEGKMQDLLILQAFDNHTITCTMAYSPLVRHVFDTQVRQAVKYVAECNEGSYVPRFEEICLAKAKDGLWYRALCIRGAKESSDLLFIDIGNVSRVPITDIRKMPSLFSAVPPLATVASISGLTEQDLLADRHLSDKLMPFERIEGKVVKQIGQQVEIYIPQLAAKKSEELELEIKTDIMLSTVSNSMIQKKDPECALLIDFDNVSEIAPNTKSNSSGNQILKSVPFYDLSLVPSLL